MDLSTPHVSRESPFLQFLDLVPHASSIVPVLFDQCLILQPKNMISAQPGIPPTPCVTHLCYLFVDLLQMSDNVRLHSVK